MAAHLLEVVVLSAADARAAVAGGADRVELVTDMAADGLTPDVAVFTEVREAVDVPVRVMVRRAAGFGRGPDLDALCADAEMLWAAGAREFVGGWLTGTDEVDAEACAAVFGALPADARWTFHRAFDHTPDRATAWHALRAMPGVDTVLTSGAPTTVADGLPLLAHEAAVPSDPADPRPRLLVGGGLRLDHVPALVTAGLDAFHIGSPARHAGWHTPIAPDAVARWRTAIG